MKTFVTLYRKELKSIRSLALIIISFMILMFLVEFIIYLPYVFSPSLKKIFLNHYYRLYEYHFLEASIYMLPVIFLFSLVIERKTGTGYQMLSLPVHWSQFIFAKFMAVISIGLLISFFNIFWRTNTIHILSQLLIGGNVFLDRHHNIVPVDFNYLVNSWLKYYAWKSMYSSILHMGLFCSFVLCSYGFMAAFKQFRLTIWAMTFFGILNLYMFVGRMIYGEFYVIQYHFVYTICAGLIFLTTGLKLLDKYGEV